METIFFVGTYTIGSASEGIYTLSFNTETGALAVLGASHAGDNPSFLAVRGDCLYAVSETDKQGQINAYRIQNNMLVAIGSHAVEGRSCCHVALSPNGRLAYAANYSSGSIFGVRLAPDGCIEGGTGTYKHTGKGPNARRQEAAHAHSCLFTPDDRFLLAADLGIDRLMVYRVAADGGLTLAHEALADAGDGPRHFAFSQDGRFVYLLAELASEVYTFAYDAESGALTRLHKVSALPGSFDGESIAADIHLSPDGHFLYASNRGHNSIAVFEIGADGRPAPCGHCGCGGSWPRNFHVTADGRFVLVANQESGNIVVFPRDAGSGLLLPAVCEVMVPKPVCVIPR